MENYLIRLRPVRIEFRTQNPEPRSQKLSGFAFSYAVTSPASSSGSINNFAVIN